MTDVFGSSLGFGAYATAPFSTASVVTDQEVTPTSVSGTGDVGILRAWGIVDASQTSNWVPVDDSESGTWDPVDDSQTSNWVPVVSN